MQANSGPQLEHWYKDLETGQSFRVVAIDDANESIEIQYLNGDIGELDSAAWLESPIAPIEPPEDWAAPFDDVEIDDLGYSDPDLHERSANELTLDDLLDNAEDLEDF